MLLVLWIDQLAAKHLEAGKPALFVRTHQTAIAGNISGENSGELAFGLIGQWGVCFHSYLSSSYHQMLCLWGHSRGRPPSEMGSDVRLRYSNAGTFRTPG